MNCLAGVDFNSLKLDAKRNAFLVLDYVFANMFSGDFCLLLASEGGLSEFAHTVGSLSNLLIQDTRAIFRKGSKLWCIKGVGGIGLTTRVRVCGNIASTEIWCYEFQSAIADILDQRKQTLSQAAFLTEGFCQCTMTS